MEIIFVYALVMKDLRDNLALDAIKYKNGNLPINSKPKRIYMYIQKNYILFSIISCIY